MLKIARNTLALTFALVAAGCLQKETDHTLYLAPDGAVTWTATEARVYSDERDPAARATEERQYLAAADAGNHRIAHGLAALGPLGTVRTLVVRAERPFTVVTEARFDSVARVLERLFIDNGLNAEVTASCQVDRGVLRLRFDFSLGAVDRESPTSVLLEDLDKLSFELTDGRFVEVDGFQLSSGGRRATVSAAWLVRAGAALDAKGTIDLSLSWTID